MLIQYMYTVIKCVNGRKVFNRMGCVNTILPVSIYYAHLMSHKSGGLKNGLLQ